MARAFEFKCARAQFYKRRGDELAALDDDLHTKDGNETMHAMGEFIGNETYCKFCGNNIIVPPIKR